MTVRFAAVVPAALLACALGSTAYAQTAMTFLEVALDEETRLADERLRRYLAERTGITFVPERPLEYDAAVNRLVGWRADRGHFLARMTPYAFVAAEMLGAQMDGLATYVSAATGGSTYHAYFVVNRDEFDRPPELASVVDHLQALGRPATFVYHSKFSTSSYFLPALFFRDQGIFHMAQPTARHMALHTREYGTSSADLVRAVAEGRFDLAAVWDATKQRFEETDSLFERYGSRVHFIQLPTSLPNDLLVISASADPATRARIQEAIRSMEHDAIDHGDFLTWQDLNGAADAREALANLRWLAREQATSATVAVRRADSGNLVSDTDLEAVRQAVRLSSTELVNFDDDFHAHPDYLWTLEHVRPRTLTLVSRISGSDVDDQRFQISFRDPEDLTRRVSTLIHARLHRIRYVWPYRPERPTILRDVDFNVPPGMPVHVRRVHWLDINRNYFRQDAEFVAHVASTDFFKLELEPNFVPPAEAGFGFDPMSNISYRVVLIRPASESTLFRLVTVALVGLLIAAATAAAVNLKRGDSTVDGDT